MKNSLSNVIFDVVLFRETNAKKQGKEEKKRKEQINKKARKEKKTRNEIERDRE